MARRKITAICERCGQSAPHIPRGRNQPYRYCSPRCSQLAMRARYPERLASRIHRTDDPDGCWLWTGPLNKPGGYGYLLIPGTQRKIYAHRAAWELENGPVPDGLFVLHNCPNGDEPRCCRVAHLWLGTQRDNMQDAKRKGRLATTRRVKPRRERNVPSKLTEDDVRAIRIATGTHDAIAARFHVSRANVSMIRQRKTWQHVE